MKSIYPDISHHHTVKNWVLFSSAVGFAISKATEGTGFVDSYLSAFVTNCEKFKIPYWLYTYLRKGNELAQAKFMVKTVKPLVKDGSYFQGYILDAEEDNPAEGIEEALNWLKTQSDKIMLYIDNDEKYREVIKDRGENCAWWYARYGKDDGTYNPKYTIPEGVDLHQYTSNGSCPGVPDLIDLNRLTGNKPLEFFTGKKKEVKGYTGDFPELPSRGYYKVGDGYRTCVGLAKEVEKLQKLINWITGSDLVVDGKYGAKTLAAVKSAQEILGVTADGLFGSKTLLAAKVFKK